MITTFARVCCKSTTNISKRVNVNINRLIGYESSCLNNQTCQTNKVSFCCGKSTSKLGNNPKMHRGFSTLHSPNIHTKHHLSTQLPVKPSDSSIFYNVNTKVCVGHFANNNNGKNRSHGSHISFIGILGFFLKKYDEESEEESDEIVKLLKRGVLSQMRGDFDLSESLFHEALLAVEDKHRENGFENNVAYLYAKINVFSRLAGLELTRGNLDKTEYLYKDTMRLCLESGVDQNDNSIVELSFKLASVYALKGHRELAEKGFEHCINVQSQKVGDGLDPDEDTLALLGMVSEGYARFLIQNKVYEVAEKHFKKAFDIGRKLYGPRHAQTLVLLNNIAVVGILQEKYEITKILLMENIAIAETEPSEEIGALYSNLGAVYLRTDELDKAYSACSEALKVGERFNNSHMQKTAKRCLAKVSRRRKDRTID